MISRRNLISIAMIGPFFLTNKSNAKDLSTVDLNLETPTCLIINKDISQLLNLEKRNADSIFLVVEDEIDKWNEFSQRLRDKSVVSGLTKLSDLMIIKEAFSGVRYDLFFHDQKCSALFDCGLRNTNFISQKKVDFSSLPTQINQLLDAFLSKKQIATIDEFEYYNWSIVKA